MPDFIVRLAGPATLHLVLEVKGFDPVKEVKAEAAQRWVQAAKERDVWVNPTPQNAARVVRALQAFGAPLLGLTEQDLARPDIVFQMGVPPNRIDIVTGIDGVTFADAWPARVTSRYGDQAVPVIGREHLILNKRATGRAQDALDAQLLERED